MFGAAPRQRHCSNQAAAKQRAFERRAKDLRDRAEAGFSDERTELLHMKTRAWKFALEQRQAAEHQAAAEEGDHAAADCS